MKKKSLSGILLILCLVFAASCDPFPSLKYEGDHKELYSAAIYAIPGCGEVYDAQVKVLETDSYGRTLFEFAAKGSCLFGRSGKQVDALMIVQESYESGAGYYRDVCYSFTNDADDADISRRINELKALNDWEKPLNEERTVYRQTTEAPIGNFGDAFRNVPNAYKSLSSGITASISSFEVYDSDKTGRKIVLWCTREANDKETYTYCIQFVQVKDGELTEPYRLDAKSLDELQEKIIEGREAFGWSKVQ